LTANLPLLIVGNFRLEERPNLPDELPDMQVLKLERLSENSIADLSVSMLGEAGRQADVLELLQRETEGNVFFLVEVVRALAEEAGRLGAVGQMALPEFVTTGGVNAVIERRLARVPAGGRGLLRLAAIAGRELDLALLERMKDRVNLDEWLIACSNSAVLEILDGQWRFAHDKLREATVSTIPATEISKSHRHVAEAIEETYPDAPEQAAILAQHWREAGDRAKEYTSVQRAGDYGLHISAFMDAKAHFERSLELAPDVIDVDGSQQAEQTNIAVKLGEVLQHLGEYEPAVKVLEQSLAHYRQIDEHRGVAHALNLLGDVYWKQGEYADAVALCEESLEIYRKFNDQAGIARALNRIGMVMAEQGDHPGATPKFEESLTFARESGDPNVSASVVNNLGVAAYAQGDYAAASDYFEQGLALAREVGNRQRAATLLGNLGSIAGATEDFAKAKVYFGQSLDLSRTIGEKRGIAQALDNLGVLAEIEEDYNLARYYLQESLALAQSVGARDRSANVLVNLGETARKQGEVDVAENYYNEALQIAHEINALHSVLDALVGLTQLTPDKMQAVEWLGLALKHPALYEYTRETVDSILEQLKAEFSESENEAGLKRGESQDLGDVAQSILNS
jgi:tetratricopeptide (TPR) repeat protein